MIVEIVGAPDSGKMPLAMGLNAALNHIGIRSSLLTQNEAGAVITLELESVVQPMLLTLLTELSHPSLPASEVNDQAIRENLLSRGQPFSLIAGSLPHRVQQALLVVQQAIQSVQQTKSADAKPAWRWYCDQCGDGECERFRLLK